MHTTTLRRSLALLAVTACAVLGFSSGAAADPVIGPQPPVKAELVLAIAPSPGFGTYPGDDVVNPPQIREVKLTCSPDGGTHPSPKEACDSLRAVNGYFERLPSIPGVYCPAVVDPVDVTATGTWGNRRVSYRETFGNSCEAFVGTDGVFSF